MSKQDSAQKSTCKTFFERKAVMQYDKDYEKMKFDKLHINTFHLLDCRGVPVTEWQGRHLKAAGEAHSAINVTR